MELTVFGPVPKKDQQSLFAAYDLVYSTTNKIEMARSDKISEKICDKLKKDFSTDRMTK